MLSEVAEEGAAWAGEISRALGIPPLATYGAGEADVAMLVEKAAQASSMKGNPMALTRDELRGILRRAL